MSGWDVKRNWNGTQAKTTLFAISTWPDYGPEGRWWPPLEGLPVWRRAFVERKWNVCQYIDWIMVYILTNNSKGTRQCQTRDDDAQSAGRGGRNAGSLGGHRKRKLRTHAHSYSHTHNHIHTLTCEAVELIRPQCHCGCVCECVSVSAGLPFPSIQQCNSEHWEW